METPSGTLNQANEGRLTFDPHLHHQIHKALVVVAGHRRVRTHHQVTANSGCQVDVLPWKQGQTASPQSSRLRNDESIVVFTVER